MREVNLKVVNTMLERGGAGDVEGLREFVHPEFVAVEADSLPYPGTFRGFEGYVELMGRLVSTWEDFGVELVQLIADDDAVALQIILRGRRGDRSFEMPACEIWKFRDGKLISATPYYFDTKKLADLYEATR